MRDKFDAMLAWCVSLGPLAAVLLALLVAILNVTMLPVFPLMVGAGIEFPRIYGEVFGCVVAIASVFGGMWLGSIIAFQLGRSVLRKSLGFDRGHDHSEFHMVVNKMIEKEGMIIVLLFRMS